MKRIVQSIIFFCFILLCCHCENRKDKSEITVKDIKNPLTADGIDTKEASTMPVMEFERVTYDFGKVIQGERLSYVFKLTNTGKSNLIISYVESSCGCTTTTPPQAPVKPGESNEIKVTFDSSGKKGTVVNYVVVTANTYPTSVVLTTTAEVINP